MVTCYLWENLCYVSSLLFWSIYQFIVTDCTDSTSSYRCDCEPGWVGKNCDLDRNDCLPSPCQNAGTCIDQLNGFTCKCRQGFRGESDISILNHNFQCLPSFFFPWWTSAQYLFVSFLPFWQVTSAKWTSTNVHPVPAWTKALVWMVWQVSLVCVNFLTVDPLVLRSSPLAPLTLVPIMLCAHTHQTTWAINVIASQVGKVSRFCIYHHSIICFETVSELFRKV